MRKKRNRIDEDEGLEVSLTPLIDTVLVLLIVFIASAPIINQSIKVSLPNGSFNEYNDKKSDFCLAIDQYGKIYDTSKNRVNIDFILNIIFKKFKLNQNLNVIVFADKDCIFGNVMELVSKIKDLGVKNVYFKTKKISF